MWYQLKQVSLHNDRFSGIDWSRTYFTITLGNEQVKSIVSVEEAIEEGDNLSFDFSYKKVFIFNEAGDRVY